MKQHASHLLQKALSFFRSPAGDRQPVRILGTTGQAEPFHPTRLCRRLMLVLPGEDAAALAQEVEQRLDATGAEEVTVTELLTQTAALLTQKHGRPVADRFGAWLEFWASGRPLVLLLGGISGTGKSTVSQELASLLGINMLQSTDMVREVMRTMDAHKDQPALHVSSFEAGRARPGGDPLAGFQTQSQMVSSAAAGVIRRAVKEKVSLILEGVHLQPGFPFDPPEESGALLVFVVISVLDPEQLAHHLENRGQHSPGRDAARYLESFDDIWGLQMQLLSQASRHGVPVVPNERLPETVGRVLEILGHRLMQERAGG